MNSRLLDVLHDAADDDGAFLRVVNFPTRGIGARSLEQLQEAAASAGTSLYKAVPLVAGIFAMEYWHFQIANFASAFVWAAVLLKLGDVGMQTFHIIAEWFQWMF